MPKTDHSFKHLLTKPSDQSPEKQIGYLNERIYGGVTLLAVNIGLLFKLDLTVHSAYVTIISTTLGLWLASIFAAVMSYRIVHDKNIPRAEFVHELAIHRGLLFAALPSVIMLGLAAFEVISIRTALIADSTLAVTALTIGILRSSKTSRNTFVTALISVGVQAALACVIVLLKVGGE